MDNRLGVLDTFVTGAAAGITGVTEKVFKKNFDLGARFLSDVPTSTLLQSSKGYAPGIGYTTNSPFDKVTLAGKETTFDDIITKFFLDPLEKFNAQKAVFAKAQLPGLKPEEISIAKTQYEDLRAIQKELSNISFKSRGFLMANFK